MKSKLTRFIVPLCLVVSVEAFAGKKDIANVVIQEHGNNQFTVSGAMGSARNASDVNQQIKVIDKNRYETRLVFANAKGRTKACSTDSSTLRRVLRAAPNNAYIYAKFKDGKCTWIEVHNSSRYAPLDH